MTQHLQFFDTSPFYYDPVEQCNLVRDDVSTDEVITNALDIIDEAPDGVTCWRCGASIGWVAGKWIPLGLVGQADATWPLCAGCFHRAEGGSS
jgi:hypothetical protein